jgi:putative addiction module CopG family antidote
MSLNVPPEFERAIRERVESGAYASEDAVFRACLEALAFWEDDQHAKLGALRRDVDEATEELRQGGGSPMDEVFARLRARLERSAVP